MLIEARNLHKKYGERGKEVDALNGIDLAVEKGEGLAIIGPSGAGKTTLLHLLGGLDIPTEGRVLLDGVDIYSLTDKERALIRNRRIGFVFQFYHLLPEFTALENVMLPAFIRGTPHHSALRALGTGQARDEGRGTRQKALDILKIVGLEDRIEHRPGELSGGEAQRVAIARSLINDPEILLCDEPTGNLDSKTGEFVYELLLDIRSKRKAALIIVTHDERISSKLERIIHIIDGNVKI